MERFDAVIVGGGPAGSTCARHLHRAGLHVVVLDRAVFPRDKVCAGWITPPVISLLELDVANVMNAGAILAAEGHYDRTHLEPYAEKLHGRFGASARQTMLPQWFMRALANRVMRSRWLTRHLVLDRWFLGRHRPALNMT